MGHMIKHLGQVKEDYYIALFLIDFHSDQIKKVKVT